MKFFQRWLRGRRPDYERATEGDIYSAYRLLLRREPDPTGLEHYRQHIAKGLSIKQMVRAFLNSEEYKQQNGNKRPISVDLGGYQVCVDKSEPEFGRAIFHTHQYEEHVRKVVRENVREGDFVIDVGANVGVITFLAASLVGRQGRVFAVEPNSTNLQLLYRGILLNEFTNVNVLPYAASSERSVFSLAGGKSNSHLSTPQASGKLRNLVQSVALDEVLGDLPKLNFVKMDIEGHEPRALTGLSRLLSRHRPKLLVEFNPRCLVDLQKQDPAAFLNQIFSTYQHVRVTSAFKDDIVFTEATALMAYWERRNVEIKTQNLLPDRMLHFDLVATR